MFSLSLNNTHTHRYKHGDYFVKVIAGTATSAKGGWGKYEGKSQGSDDKTRENKMAEGREEVQAIINM